MQKLYTVSSKQVWYTDAPDFSYSVLTIKQL